MLAKILLLSSMLFAVIYPLSFWINFRDPLKNYFHRFHLGVSSTVAGLVAIWLLRSSTPESIKFHILAWAIMLLGVTAFYWQKEFPNPIVLLAPFVYGKYSLYLLLFSWGITDKFLFVLVLLAGFIFCASLFAMNLGHWYLNVHGLPIDHLKRSVYAFWMLCGIRILADIYVILYQNVFYNGEWIRVTRFMTTMDGFMIWLGLLFGTLFPAITLYFVKGTLDVKSNQSATGILYAILCGLIIGDITAKYYLFKFNLTF